MTQGRERRAGRVAKRRIGFEVFGAALALTLTLTLPLATIAGCGRDEPKPLNVVIIALDTLRPDHLGCYGYERDTSPGLDRWAAQSVVFDNAQSAAPWTAPSLISLMTSLYPSVHRVSSFNEPGQMNERVTTLAEVLRARGYRTGAFTDGGYAKPQFGLGQGFQVYPLNEGDNALEHASNMRDPRRLHGNVERTLKWLDDVEDEPFFLFFHTYEIHGPYQPPEEYVKRFRPDWDEAAEEAKVAAAAKQWLETRDLDGDGLRALLAHKEHCAPMAAWTPEQLNGFGQKMKEHGVGSIEPERMTLWRDLYDGEIRHSDHELERLLARLDTPERRDDTLVVFVSDHGEAFGEHDYVGHGSVLFDVNLRVLLMIRAPGIEARRVADVVRTVDVMPTVLELVRAPRESLALQGRSLAPLMRGEELGPAPSFSHALSQSQREGRLWSVREGAWRLIWDEERGEARMYDLAADPQELRDVAAEHPQLAERLMGLMRAQCGVDQAYFDRASGPVKPLQLDAKELAELAKLGYAADPNAPPPSGLGKPSYCSH